VTDATLYYAARDKGWDPTPFESPLFGTDPVDLGEGCRESARSALVRENPEPVQLDLFGRPS
jgi:hypothetical protein